MQHNADLHSHRIEGIALAAERAGLPAEFSVPLISHVTGNLYQGGCRDGVMLDDSWEYVISLYPWEQYKIGTGTKRWEFRLYDSEKIEDEETLVKIAELINDCRSKGKTLVHCQAGLNRSGLLAALALMESGVSAETAIGLLREKRHALVLCNQSFERWLRERDSDDDQCTA